MMIKNKRTIISAIVVLLIVLPIVYFSVSDTDIKTILLGVLSSILASFIFTIFSDAVFDEKQKELETLKSAVSVLEDMKTKGVLDIRSRSEYENEFWIEFAETTNKKWFISGRTLNRWLENDIKDKFRENICRILKYGGEITFIIYKDPSEKKERDILCEFIKKEIFPQYLSIEDGKVVKKGKFRICEVDALPYLYNANEHRIIVAPYFSHTGNNNNLMFVLNRNCLAGQEYARDFQSVIRHASENKWEQEYLDELRRKSNGGKAGNLNDNSTQKQSVNTHVNAGKKRKIQRKRN